jgi:6-phosphofructokinase 1
VSEGIKDPEGRYISAQSSQVDQFVHVMLNGTGKYLEGLVQNTIGCKVRSVELNVLQRCASHISSSTDVEEAFCLGIKGVVAALNGATGEMVLLKRISNQPYSVEYGTIPIQQVANVEKQVPDEWIAPAGNDIMPQLLDYLRPLILGETNLQYKNGIPDYLYL